MLGNRLRKNRRKVARWAAREGITCYRLYDRDIPEVSLAIDWYEGHLHIAEYAGRRGSTVSELEPERFEAWIEAARELLEVPAERVFVKARRRQTGRSQYEKQGDESYRLEVSEGGHRFIVNLSDYLDTGLFLDHRPARGWVEKEAAGKRVLNLFAYTGSFSVYAAAGGAASTTTVDVSKTYLGWAAENLALNGFPEGDRHAIVRADVLQWLVDPKTKRRRWDLIVLDPPTYSVGAKMEGSLDIQRDHAGLLGDTLALLSDHPEAALWFSNNKRGFRLDRAALEGWMVRDRSRDSIPFDFRDREIHRCWRISRAL